MEKINMAKIVSIPLAIIMSIVSLLFPCTATLKNENGTYSADKSRMEFIFQSSADEIGMLTGTTEGGYVVDESWLENDGLVNTVSASAPSSAPLSSSI